MRIESRLKKAAIMCALWLVIILSSAAYVSVYTDIGIDAFLLVILILISGVFQLIGAMVYIGSYKELAGFNTMSDKELEQFEHQYDTEKMMSFIGVSFSLISYGIFFASVVAIELSGILIGIVAMIIFLIVSLIALVIYVNVSKSFLRKDGRPPAKTEQ